MGPRDRSRAAEIASKLTSFSSNVCPLPGIATPERKSALVAQVIDSLRRIEFVHHIRDAKIDPRRMDPTSSLFDPLRAAVLHNRQGAPDEAWWLTFLATHFGKHSLDGWRLTQNVYGRLGQVGVWDWAAISADPEQFSAWLELNSNSFATGNAGRFSNHRKYESLKTSSRNGSHAVLSSYVKWIAPPRTHNEMVRETHLVVGQDPKAVFRSLYESMSSVIRFGRLGKFDFLTMLGKLGIAPIEPGSAFLTEATGPLAGARLLFENNSRPAISTKLLDEKVIQLGDEVELGMQVLEDSLCNWQKSPDQYRRFRG